jgi:trimeric autotransporter adhesin
MKNIFTFLLIVTFGHLFGQNTLLKDPNVGTESSNPHGQIDVNGTIYFFTNDKTGKKYVTKSDGTNAGTNIAKTPELPSTRTGPYFNENTGSKLFKFNNSVVFTAASGDNIYDGEPWISNGTEAGTFQIKDINIGINTSSPEHYTQFGSKFLFTVGNNYSEPWISDGTEAGTMLLKEIHPYEGSKITEFVPFQGKMYFWADDGVHGLELWSTDGTEFGTNMVADFNPGPSGSATVNTPIIVTSNRLFFKITTDLEGSEIGSCDGTSMFIHPVLPGVASSNPTQLTLLSFVFGSINFIANDGANNKLYVCRNQASGYYVSELNNVFFPFNEPSDLTSVNEKVFFTAKDASSGIALWTTEGFNVTKVQDINLGTVSNIDDTFPSANEENQRLFFNYNGNLFFVATDGVSGYELWKTTFQNQNYITTQVTDINTMGDTKFKDFKFNYNYMFFLAKDNQKYKMWRIENFYWNPVAFDNIYTSTAFDNPYPLISNDYNFFFTAYNPNIGFELFKSIGWNFEVVKDINTTPFKVNPDNIFKIKESNATQTVFDFEDQKNGHELWTTNGKTSGTYNLKDFIPYPVNNAISQNGDYVGKSIYGNKFITYNNEIYFKVNGGIWKTNGVNQPILLVQDNDPNEFPTDVYFEKMNNKLYFVLGNKIYETLGLPSNTNLIFASPLPVIRNLTFSNNFLFFVTRNSIGQNSLWKTNGTLNNASIVKVLSTYQNGGSLQELEMIEFNNNLYFFYDGGLWKSDGTSSGTSIFFPDLYGYKFAKNNTHLYFNSEYKVWRSDGTLMGTFPIINAHDYKIFNNSIYFTPLFSASLYKNSVTPFVDELVYDFPIPFGHSVSEPNLIFTDAKSILISFEYRNNETEALTQNTTIDLINGNISSPIIQRSLAPNFVYYPQNFHAGNDLVYFIAISPSDKISLHVMKDCFVTKDETGVVNTNYKNETYSKLTSTQTISSPSRTDYFSQKSIELKPGFKVNPGSVFKAQIGGCVHDPAN